MNIYKVEYYKDSNLTEKASKEVESDNIFDLAVKLETKLLYRYQFRSIFSINLVEEINEEKQEEEKD